MRIFLVLIIVICLSAVALARYYRNIADIRTRIRKIATRTLSLSVVCFIGVTALISALSCSGNFLTSVLSADFIADGRAALKLLFGSESVFASLRMLGAVSLFLFSFASCALCVFCIRFFCLCKLVCVGEIVEDIYEETVSVSVVQSVRRFALLSRYLI